MVTSITLSAVFAETTEDTEFQALDVVGESGGGGGGGKNDGDSEEEWPSPLSLPRLPRFPSTAFSLALPLTESLEQATPASKGRCAFENGHITSPFERGIEG